MANTTQEVVYKSFTEAAGGLTESLGTIAGIARDEAVRPRVAEKAGGSTSSTGGGPGSEALSIATTVLGSGLGIVPLIAGLVGLFTGGGESSTPPPLVKYAMPESLHFQAADTESGVGELDYDQMGMPRDYLGTGGPSTSRSGGATPAGADGAQGGSETRQESTSGVQQAPQVHVNVQAMDARSFLDHSSEIAQAVRNAMLNLSSINDVVSDL